MRRSATSGRPAARLIALALLPSFWGCAGDVADPAEVRTRIFQVAEADGQLLPAHHSCPSPEEGIVTGAHFLAGELVLYPERTFTWRYTIEQYVASAEQEQTWVEAFTSQGTYLLRGDSLALTPDAGAPRHGRISGDVVELAEAVPCRFPIAGSPDHLAELHLTEVGRAD